MCCAGFIFLGEENKVGTIDAAEVSRVSVEFLKEANKGLGSDRPSSFEEKGTKSVRAGTGIGVHAVNNIPDFSIGEGGSQMIQIKGTFRVQVVQVKGPDRFPGTPHQSSIEHM
jgi:hypothetical protein